MQAGITLHRGTRPLLISLPHDGTALPDDIAVCMTPQARLVPDTDWHVSRLYAFAAELGASILIPTYSRYVIDLNRPPDGAALYPGKNETGLCPLQTFAGDPIYAPGQAPDGEEIQARVKQYWRPYHEALQAELERLRVLHGHVVLWEGHSIRSEVPMFFEGKLPDFNLGTVDGASCSIKLEQRLSAVMAAQSEYRWVVNGRFKGGYITRRYGNPDAGVDAIQLELAQCNYMDERSFDYQEEKANKIQKLIVRLLDVCRLVDQHSSTPP